jgi:hypothetical protein
VQQRSCKHVPLRTIPFSINYYYLRVLSSTVLLACYYLLVDIEHYYVNTLSYLRLHVTYCAETEPVSAAMPGAVSNIEKQELLKA